MTRQPPTDGVTGTLAADAAPDVPAVLAACHARLLEREGIAMFVAIDDVRADGRLRVRDEMALLDGARAAQLLAAYDAALEAVAHPEPTPEEPDHTGARELIDALVVLSEAHLRARTDLEGESR